MKGFRSFGFGASVLLLAGLESAEFTTFISDNSGIFGALVGVGIMVLRAFTTSKIFKKD